MQLSAQALLKPFTMVATSGSDDNDGSSLKGDEAGGDDVYEDEGSEAEGGVDDDDDGEEDEQEEEDPFAELGEEEKEALLENTAAVCLILEKVCTCYIHYHGC